MKTSFKFIKFEKNEFRSVWNILNRKDESVLGEITYYHPWKKWVFAATNNDIIFDAVCLKDIVEFMEQL